VHILSTLLRPDSGTAVVNGHDVVKDPAGVRAAIGLTGQFSAVDTILSMQDESARIEVQRLLLLFENALPNFLLAGRTQPFTQLPVELQERVLLEWRDSRITLRRSGYLALRTLVNAAYYASPAVWPALKYPGPPSGFHDPSAPVWKGPAGVVTPPGGAP